MRSMTPASTSCAGGRPGEPGARVDAGAQRLATLKPCTTGLDFTEWLVPCTTSW
jgi:hypothetical protein